MEPITTGALIAGGATLLGGFLDSQGQKSTNKTNLQIAREQNKFSERMSNTAHQREVTDLKQAGLNPILSAKTSGASTPTAAGATMQNAMTPLANSAINLMQQYSQVQKLQAEIKNIQTDTAIKKPKATVYGEIGDAVENLIGGVKSTAKDSVSQIGDKSAAITSGADLFKNKVKENLQKYDKKLKQGKAGIQNTQPSVMERLEKWFNQDLKNAQSKYKKRIKTYKEK